MSTSIKNTASTSSSTGSIDAVSVLGKSAIPKRHKRKSNEVTVLINKKIASFKTEPLIGRLYAASKTWCKLIDENENNVPYGLQLPEEQDSDSTKVLWEHVLVNLMIRDEQLWYIPEENMLVSDSKIDDMFIAKSSEGSTAFQIQFKNRDDSKGRQPTITPDMAHLRANMTNLTPLMKHTSKTARQVEISALFGISYLAQQDYFWDSKTSSDLVSSSSMGSKQASILHLNGFGSLTGNGQKKEKSFNAQNLIAMIKSAKDVIGENDDVGSLHYLTHEPTDFVTLRQKKFSISEMAKKPLLIPMGKRCAGKDVKESHYYFPTLKELTDRFNLTDAMLSAMTSHIRSHDKESEDDRRDYIDFLPTLIKHIFVKDIKYRIPDNSKKASGKESKDSIQPFAVASTTQSTSADGVKPVFHDHIGAIFLDRFAHKFDLGSFKSRTADNVISQIIQATNGDREQQHRFEALYKLIVENFHNSKPDTKQRKATTHDRPTMGAESLEKAHADAINRNANSSARGRKAATVTGRPVGGSPSRKVTNSNASAARPVPTATTMVTATEEGDVSNYLADLS